MVSSRRLLRLRVALLSAFALLSALLFCACGGGDDPRKAENRIVMSLEKPVATLDPALAADTTSQQVCAAFYDTLLQYRYDMGDCVLEPSMLERMPRISPDGLEYVCTLRDDLWFQDGPPFAGLDRTARRITARDVAFSLLRLADARLHSPGFWLIRDRIRGLEPFIRATESAAEGDLSPYDLPCEGLEVRDDRTLVIRLTRRDPRFLYALALPYSSVVSRRAVAFWGEEFSDHPNGSGPFRLAEWNKEYVLRMERNPDYRTEADGRRLPEADAITCYLVKQPLASWLMFLQGELDLFIPDAECFEAVVGPDLQLAPLLRERGIRLLHRPELQTNYIGFNFSDPILGGNPWLRKAIALAFDRRERVLHSGSRFIEAFGPIPPGIPGAILKSDETRDLDEARRCMVRAGYPGGIDPRTGRPLELKFDQTGADTFFRQTAELMALDMKEIGIAIRPSFNTRPRFLQKLDSGEVQLFRLSWTADYPDAENFLQLFYGKNKGSCNRVNFGDPEYDRMYEELLRIGDSAEYERQVRRMTAFLKEKNPWIFETHTVAFVMTHQWLDGCLPHDLAFNRWKHFRVDPALRVRAVRDFHPFSLSELIPPQDR